MNRQFLIVGLVTTLVAWPRFVRAWSGSGKRLRRARRSRQSALHLSYRHSRDGIGKFYMGREIAHVMGHLGAGWFERSSSEAEERQDPIKRSSKAGDKVADIGVGTGYFARRIARDRPQGPPTASTSSGMLDLLKRNLRNAGINNVEGVLGTPVNPNLPANTIDLTLMVDVYHELHPTR